MVQWTRNVHLSWWKMPTATTFKPRKNSNSRSGSRSKTENISIKSATNRSNSKALRRRLQFFLMYVWQLCGVCLFVWFTRSKYKVHIFKMSFYFLSVLPFFSANISVHISLFIRNNWEIRRATTEKNASNRNRRGILQNKHISKQTPHGARGGEIPSTITIYLMVSWELAIEQADSKVDTE